LSGGDLADTLAHITGHRARDLPIFIQALTHGSSGKADYQRLEFLGDRVLGLVISTELYARYPAAPEGELSSRFNALVSGAACAVIARQLDLPELVELGAQAVGDGGRYSDNIAADVAESLIGALYLDGGLETARAFILAQWGPMLDGQHAAPKHPKAALQEWALARGRRPPEYAVVSRDGPDHAPRFTVRASIGKLAEATAEGASKQAAEKDAAAALLTIIEGLKE
jgi:ribonuclease III